MSIIFNPKIMGKVERSAEQSMSFSFVPPENRGQKGVRKIRPAGEGRVRKLNIAPSRSPSPTADTGGVPAILRDLEEDDESQPYKKRGD